MIFITGDTHGDWMERFSSKNFPEGKDLHKSDFVIVLGDFGLWLPSKEQDHNLDWLDKKPWTTLFIDGNHENFDLLYSMPEQGFAGGRVHVVRDSVWHLMRGYVFTIEQKKFFAFGGAKSHDISSGILDPADLDFEQKYYELNRRHAMFRVKGFSWWPQEQASEEEMRRGKESLATAGNRVDYVLTHSPFSQLVPFFGVDRDPDDRMSPYLQEIKQENNYHQWFFGHMHAERMFQWERAICTYYNIMRIV